MDAAVTTIRGARYAAGPHEVMHGFLAISDGKLVAVKHEHTIESSAAVHIDLDGFLLLPGLVNAHDHLQYGLHPRIGDPPYDDYVEWGDDIHANSQALISRYNSVPRDVRVWWGGIRNLLSGVTTVCHHDPLWPALQSDDYPVKVLPNYGWAHSVRLASDIRRAWSATPDGAAFFIHACEGVNERSRSELIQLDSLGMLDATTVLIHGLALDECGIALLQKRLSSLILCLSSNYFLYGRLPKMKCLDAIDRIALGNDSPLTAAGDLLDEVRFAIEYVAIPTERAYRMITDIPASMLRLLHGEGHIRELASADFIAVRDDGSSPHERLRSLSWRDVEFVMVAGQVRLASEYVWQVLPPNVRDGMERVWVDDEARWLRAPIQQLFRDAEACLGMHGVRLNGRTIQLASPAASASPVADYELSTRL
jgi:cytosine/adenosine deaminase-related metal-dependent hydrolase